MVDDHRLVVAFGAGMQNIVQRARRVVVALTPRLLSDSLVTLLAGHGLDVVAMDADTSHGDVVLVTDDSVVAAGPDVVVRLVTGAAGVATAVVQTSSAGPSVHIEGMPAILRAVSDLSTGLGHDSASEG